YFVQLHNKVTVYVKPFTFRDSIKAELQKYHEAQAMKLLANEDLEDEAKAQKYAESIRKIATLMVELCANSVTRIIDPNGKELNASRDNILEWIKLLPRADAERITSKINEINN